MAESKINDIMIEGGNADIDNNYPYTSTVGGSETRPRNIAMNYIIKY